MKSLYLRLCMVMLVLGLLLAACGGAPTTGETATSPAGSDAPTAATGGDATAEPTMAMEETAEPTMAMEETAEPTAATGDATAEPTSGAAEGGTYEDVDPTGLEITFWHQHTRAREAALQEIVAEFNATNEYSITVTAENQGDYPDIFNKMLPILGTQDVPDLVVAYQNQAATYQLADGLADINPLVNSAKWGLSQEEQADFFPGFFNQDVFPSFEDQRLGFPPNRSMEMLYYNIDWLKELGYDAPPASPEQFKEAACKASQQPFSKATGEGTSLGYELSVDASRFASLTFGFGGDVFDYENNKYTYNSEAAVSAMTLLQEMFSEKCAAVVAENFGDQTDFGAGRTLFTIGSSSGLPFYTTAVSDGAQFDWSVAAIPHSTTDPQMNIYGASVSIPKSTPERELAAWLFLKYYTGTEAQAKWAQASQYFPVRKSVADGLTEYFEKNPAYKTAFDLLPYGKAEPPTPGYDFVREKVNEAMTAIVDGADVQETLDALNEEANQILEEQLAQQQ